LWGKSAPEPDYDPSIDQIRGEITQTIIRNGREDVKSVSKFDGSWLDGLSFDGVPYWTRNEFVPFPTLPIATEEVLPSDATLRADLKALAAGDQDLAQTTKTALEEIQRKDAKLRKKMGAELARECTAQQLKRQTSKDAEAAAAGDKHDSATSTALQDEDYNFGVDDHLL